MKLVRKNEELVIHGERSQSRKQVPVFDEMPQGLDFYTVEFLNATDEDLALQNPMPAVYKINATVMLQNGFEPGFGLEEIPKGSLNLIRSLLKDENMVWGIPPQMTM